MIAVNASTSPHSSATFTPFGSDALTLAGEQKAVVPLGFDTRTSSQAAGKPTIATLLSRDRARSEACSVNGMNADVEDRGRDLVAVCFLIHFRSRFALTPCSS